MENLKIAIKAAIEASKKILEIYHKDFQVFTKMVVPLNGTT